ncbi:MAG: hypothetical protein ACLU9S_18750 [Oscillospiraceae bacterium]
MKVWNETAETNVASALVLALIPGLCPGAVAASGGYTDVPENQLYPHIQDVTERGVMNGGFQSVSAGRH